MVKHSTDKHSQKVLEITTGTIKVQLHSAWIHGKLVLVSENCGFLYKKDIKPISIYSEQGVII
jgi:hypothetical protein